MAATFDCPKCGAPLDFEPEPGDETVECLFCHETVIIPEELRIPLPRVVVYQQSPEKRSKSTTGAIFAVVGVFILGIVIFAISANQSSTDVPSDSSSSDLGSETSAALSVVDDATATVEAQATNEALQSLLLVEQKWPASLSETFMDNSRKWETGDVRDSYISGNRSISNGTYTWKITSVKSAFDFSYPVMPDQQDFYASVDMKLGNMPDDPDADAGMVLRYNNTDQTWYYYSVNNKGQYYFGWYNGTDWSSLIPETDSSAIQPGETNRLAVGVQGSQFIFLINGQMVDHFIDENLKSGSIGVAVNLPQPDEKASIEFANFTVLSPAPNP